MYPKPLYTWKLSFILSGVVTLLAALLLVGTTVAYLLFRPNASMVRPWLRAQHWPVMPLSRDAVEMAGWKGELWLVEGAGALVKVSRSFDGRQWTEVATLERPGSGRWRFRFIGGGADAWLFAIGKASTRVASSSDGIKWKDWSDVTPEGWAINRPRTRDGRNWFAAAVDSEGRVGLLRSRDGVKWELQSALPEALGASAAVAEFQGDGKIVVAASLGEEGLSLQDPRSGTLVGVASPPYKKWAVKVSHVTRLDDPCLFALDGNVFASGRHLTSDRPGATAETHRWLSRSRTSLYRVDPEGLIYLTDLPSAGETGCAGIALMGGTSFLAYTTSPVERDFPLALGRWLGKELRVAKFPLSALASSARPSAAARSISSEKREVAPVAPVAPAETMPPPPVEEAPSATESVPTPAEVSSPTVSD